LVTEAVAQAMAPGDHGSTFAANPLVTALASVVFNRISDPQFLAGVREKGRYLEGRLHSLQNDGLPITAIRGRGLMWAIETPFNAAQVVSAGYGEGIIVVTAGEKIVRFVPPLVIERQHIDELASALGRALRKVQESG
jgi:acetylornithine/succinyldiaminopimelate/putrescine aminotransferase